MSEAVITVVKPQPTSPWLISHGGANAKHIRMRLFCFHYAGATASIFRSWQDALPDEVEVVAVQLPGREYRMDEPALTNMAQIVPPLAESFPPLLDKPYVFFGHSMGALVGFDVVRVLRAQGFPEPKLFVASGRNAPQFKWRDAGIQTLPDEEFLAAVSDYNGMPEALLAEESLRDLWMPRLRADLTVSAMYEYVEGRPMDCPVVVMFGAEDGLVSDAGLRGWLGQTTGGVRFYCYPGDHFFLHSAERLVLAKLSAELEDHLAQERHS